MAEFGLDLDTKNLFTIEEVNSGLTNLVCPFCHKKLVAKKGMIKEHHFAHVDAEICNISDSLLNSSAIPLFDGFGVLDAHERKYLERLLKYQHVYSFEGMDEAIQRLQKLKIIHAQIDCSEDLYETIENLRSLGFEFSFNNNEPEIPSELTSIIDAFKPIVNIDNAWKKNITKKSIRLTEQAQEYVIKSMFDDRESTYFDAASIERKNACQLFWLQAQDDKIFYFGTPAEKDLHEKKKDFLQQFKLYIMRFELEIHGSVQALHKIGITSRETTERMKEVAQYLKEFGNIQSSEVVYEKIGIARLEKLLHRHFKKQNVTIGTHQEFFNFDTKKLKLIIKDLNKIY